MTCPGFPLIPVVIDGNCTIELGVVTRYSDAAPLMPWLSRSSVQGANPFDALDCRSCVAPWDASSVNLLYPSCSLGKGGGPSH